MKRFACWMLILTLLVCACGVGLADRTITVNGNATVRAEADLATVSLGVETRAKTAAEASAANAQAVETVRAALISAGVAEEDITTSGYFVNVLYDYTTETADGFKALGYTVNNTVSVLVRDTDRVGAVIDAALDAGANRCDGISFSSARVLDYQSQALKGAVADARRKAELLAEACGAELGKIRTVTEVYSSGTYEVVEREAAAEDTAAQSKAAGTWIHADGVSFTANITVTFELKDQD